MPSTKNVRAPAATLATASTLKPPTRNGDADFDAAQNARLGEIGAQRLAALSGAPSKLLKGAQIGDLKAKLGHMFDPRWLFMQRVCGEVVRTDPVTGQKLPVPFATVQVEDTDCSFLGYFPTGWKWGWLFPMNCRREVIASVKTDACGRFCVWVPRFDIDWLLRWRHERVCFPTLFDRPSWRDLIDELRERLPREPIPRGPFPPGPGPDPGPLLDLPALRRQLQGSDSALAEGLARLETLRGKAFGEPNQALQAALDAPAPLALVPPLPDFAGSPAPKAGTDLPALARASIAAQLRAAPQAFDSLRIDRWVGPLRRCVDVFVAEWTPILDVPDITFRVLQDTNGDGVEETIYGETYFDVRWNSGTLPFVTLEAGPQARTAPACVPAGGVPCGNLPALVTAGRLPLTGDPATFDPGTGYGVRTNRPHASGVTVEPMNNLPAQSPLFGRLPLFGCARTNPQATHYRVAYRYKAPGSASFGASAPFTGISWWLYRLNAVGIGEWHAPVANSQGWYPISLPAGPNAWLPQDLLLDWPSGQYPDGTYELTLELGAPPGPLSQKAAAVQIVIDNHAPSVSFTAEWRKVGATDWLPIGGPCPLVRRGSTPVAVEFRVSLLTSSLHFRNAWLRPSVCGGTGMLRTGGSGGSDSTLGYERWHTSVAESGATLEAVYRLDASALQGTYGFYGRTVSRAFDNNELNPPPQAAFEYDDASPPIYRDFSMLFSVIDAN